MKKILILSLSLMALSCSESMEKMTKRVFDVAKVQYTELEARVPGNKMPNSFEKGANTWSSLNGWVSGFLPGTLWYIYQYSGDEAIKELAQKQTLKLSGIVDMKTHHDIGFQVNSSFGNAYRLLGDESYLDVIRPAAAKLASRYSDVTKVIKSWESNENRQYPVIIDNMMNLELLMFAGKLFKTDSLLNIACTHANTTMVNHFREDYSTYHVVDYNPETGEVIYRKTAQGFSDASCWGRGESWALYGYTMMYREAGDRTYLDQACNIADYLLAHLPEDGVTYWDINAPGTPWAFPLDAEGAPKAYKYKEGDHVERDASAAAITASALVELSTLTADKARSKKYLKTACRILHTLASDEYLAAPGENGGFLLKHSVGNLHGNSAVDVPLSYADYYFLEALIRYQGLEK